MILAKIHEAQGQRVLAACDEDLLGKTLEEGEISLTVSEAFYGGDRVEETKLLQLLKECNSANLVGEQTLEVVKRLYKLQMILYIGDVPHAQIFKIEERQKGKTK